MFTVKSKAEFWRCIHDRYPDRNWFSCREAHVMGCREPCCNSCHNDEMEMGIRMVGEYECGNLTIVLCCGKANWYDALKEA